MTNKKVASDIRPMSERVTARPPSGLRKAKQAFKDEVDINSIVSRFIKSGVPIPAPQSRPTFLDMASLPANLQDALQLRAFGFCYFYFPSCSSCGLSFAS